MKLREFLALLNDLMVEGAPGEFPGYPVMVQCNPFKDEPHRIDSPDS
jgi:hypothetical protein